MTDEIKKQILDIRDTGRTNMFDANMVQMIAYELGFLELVEFLKRHRREYVHFIISGD